VKLKSVYKLEREKDHLSKRVENINVELTAFYCTCWIFCKSGLVPQTSDFCFPSTIFHKRDWFQKNEILL